jgi:hypothetical protein
MAFMKTTNLLMLFYVAAVIILLFQNEIAATADQTSTYLGANECGSCHESIFKVWQKTKHAAAFNSLKKTSQENLAGCQQCHVTAFEEPGGFIDAELTPELVGVQCEECHGPGKVHTANPAKPGSIVAKVPETKCRKCHTAGQDRNFDYAKKVRLLH